MRSLKVFLAAGISLLAACSSASSDAPIGEGAGAGSGAGAGAGFGAGAGAATPQGPSGVSSAQCDASPAPAVFGNALCVCGDFKDVGNLVVHGNGDADLGSVAVNGTTTIIANAAVDGSWASGKGLSATGNFDVGRSVYSPANVDVAGIVEIGQNLHVGGSLSGFGNLTVKGELGIAGGNRLLGLQDVGTRGTYKDAPPAPCGCEGTPGYLDVDAAVAKAKTQNDNGAKNIPTSLGTVGVTDLTLESGSYYFAGAVKSIGLQRLRIRGAVSMYIDGSLEQIGAEVFDIAEGATLDLYIRGTLQTIGNFSVGDTKQAAALRLFIGGADDVSLAVGNQTFNGAVYAPRARLKYVGNTVVKGALFARELTGIGNMDIHAARPTPPAGCSGSDGASTPGAPGSPGSPSGSSQSPRDDGVGTPPVR